MVLNNTTTNSDPFLPSILISQILGGFLLVLSVVGLVIYIIFIVLVFTRKRFHQQSFFVIAGWLGIADCICLILMIGYASPCIILQASLSTSRVIGGILNIGWFSGLPLVTLMAANRYFCICDRERYRKFFTLRNTKYYCVASWVFGTIYSTPSFFACCPLFFDWILMSWGWNLNYDGSTYLSYGELTMVVFTVIVIYSFNVLVFRDIQKVKKEINRGELQEHAHQLREKKIFIQFFITSIWLLIFDVPFIAIGYIPNPAYTLGYFVTIAYAVNCSINGLVYILINKTIQVEIKRVIARHVTVHPNSLHTLVTGLRLSAKLA